MWERLRNYSIPPGTMVSVLASAAAIYAIIPPDNISNRERAIFIVFVFLLAAAEIAIIHRERNQQEIHRLNLFHKIDGWFSVMLIRFDIILSLIKADPHDKLKNKVLNLSKSIIDFGYARLENTPSFPEMLEKYQPSTSDTPTGKYYSLKSLVDPTPEPYTHLKRYLTYYPEYTKMMDYERKTATLYVERFLPRVSEVRNELAKNGVIDEDFDLFYKKPSMASLIIEIGGMMQKMAERLPVKPQ